jgi:hypothetical protein
MYKYSSFCRWDTHVEEKGLITLKPGQASGASVCSKKTSRRSFPDLAGCPDQGPSARRGQRGRNEDEDQ